MLSSTCLFWTNLAIIHRVGTMQDLEMPVYTNDGVGYRVKRSGNKEKPDRRCLVPLFLIAGVLCITQAVLNISLRVAWSDYPSVRSTCNLTQAGGPTKQPKAAADCTEMANRRCNRLQERFTALTADKNLCENRNNILNNRIKKLEEDIQRLQMNEGSECGSSQPCPSGWREINSRCYYLSNESKSWEESRSFCKRQKADLVVINDQREQRALYRLDADVDLLFWIGLHGTDGSFSWVDGTALTTRFWKSGQPDHGGPNNVEDCVEMYHFDPPLSCWNDAPCGKRRRWLCEKESCQVSIGK